MPPSCILTCFGCVGNWIFHLCLFRYAVQVMTQFADEQKEKEQIGILLARKNYLALKGVTSPDSLKVRVVRLSNDDPNFRTYLKTSIPDIRHSCL